MAKNLRRHPPGVFCFDPAGPLVGSNMDTGLDRQETGKTKVLPTLDSHPKAVATRAEERPNIPSIVARSTKPIKHPSNHNHPSTSRSCEPTSHSHQPIRHGRQATHHTVITVFIRVGFAPPDTWFLRRIFEREGGWVQKSMHLPPVRA